MKEKWTRLKEDFVFWRLAQSERVSLGSQREGLVGGGEM